MFSLIAFVFNIEDLRLLGGLNGPRGRLGGSNENSYIVPQHKKLSFLVFYLLSSYL